MDVCDDLSKDRLLATDAVLLALVVLLGDENWSLLCLDMDEDRWIGDNDTDDELHKFLLVVWKRVCYIAHACICMYCIDRCQVASVMARCINVFCLCFSRKCVMHESTNTCMHT